MRRGLLLSLLSLLGALACAARLPAAEPGDGRPYGLNRRVPWTTSRVVGSPEPPPPYRVQRAFPRLKTANPIAVVHEPGTRNLLVVDQRIPWVGAGRILRVRDDGSGDQVETLLELDWTIYGLAFHPQFEKNGYVFVGCNGPVTADDRDIPGRRFKPEVVKHTRVWRFTIERQPPHRINPKSGAVIIEWPSNGHNGGDLAFGTDGMLYVSSGDGTPDSDTDLAGQDLSRLLAKVLRIDVDRPAPGQAYRVPADNPFCKLDGARPETWAYGFRNPWRLHIDRQSGDLWVGNNGQDLWEQIYLVEKGANYGWSVLEGTHPFLPRKPGPTPFSRPIAEHHHSEARSLTGGVVYRGKKLPELAGAYLYGDWSTGKVWGLRHVNGKVVWQRELADTPLQISGFGLDSQGELLIVDYGGGLYRLEPAPPQPDRPPFPTRLSQTGLFVSVKDHRPEPALIPYTVNAPLWSDGAEKERFIALPGLATIDFTTERGWNFPDGTVLVKTFSLLLEANNPASRRRIETRLLTRQQGEWAGYSYVWNEEQTEAELVPAAGMDRLFTIREATGPRRQTWHYPSRAECMVCHSRAANFVLGPSLLQMNAEHDYGPVRDNQLRALEHVGAFRVHGLEHLNEVKRQVRQWRETVLFFAPGRRSTGVGSAGFARLNPRLGEAVDRFLDASFDELAEKLRQQPVFTSTLPRRPEQLPRLVDPYDPKHDLERRARSYLHANCAHCHVTAGGGNARIDLDYATPRPRMHLFSVPPQHQGFDLARPLLIAPGQPERSILYQRMARRGAGQMPPLASHEVDTQAVELIRDWIRSTPR